MPQARPDLVLVNPASRPQVYQSLAETLSAVEPPVWAGLMATYVRNQGFGVEIIDAEAEGLSAAQAAQRCRDLNPRWWPWWFTGINLRPRRRSCRRPARSARR